MKILLIEDELSVLSFIKRGLQEQGNQVIEATNGKLGLKLALQGTYDVIITDVVMPELTGVELCHKLKNEHKIDTPILMLTALSSTDDIVTGLETGADDYLTKPFKFKELLARLNALTRRAIRTFDNNNNLLVVHDLKVNLSNREVHRSDVLIELTAKEFRLLEYLINHKNRVVSRTEILENVWDVNFDLGTNVIDVYINYLRKKIEVPFNSKLIKTVVGMGYIIKD